MEWPVLYMFIARELCKATHLIFINESYQYIAALYTEFHIFIQYITHKSGERPSAFLGLTPTHCSSPLKTLTALVQCSPRKRGGGVKVLLSQHFSLWIKQKVSSSMGQCWCINPQEYEVHALHICPPCQFDEVVCCQFCDTNKIIHLNRAL